MRVSMQDLLCNNWYIFKLSLHLICLNFLQCYISRRQNSPCRVTAAKNSLTNHLKTVYEMQDFILVSLSWAIWPECLHQPDLFDRETPSCIHSYTKLQQLVMLRVHSILYLVALNKLIHTQMCKKDINILLLSHQLVLHLVNNH